MKKRKGKKGEPETAPYLYEHDEVLFECPFCGERDWDGELCWACGGITGGVVDVNQFDI